MNKFVLLAFMAALIGCGERQSTNPTWGYLPSMTFEKGICSDKTYPNQIPASIVDFAEPLYPMDKRAANISHQMYLEETCFVASIMMSTYESPADQIYNHYTIDIKIPHLDSRCSIESKPDICKQNPIAHTVVFQRELRPEDVGQYFKNKRMEDVVRFDKETNIVRFIAGKNTYEYLLPISNPALKRDALKRAP